MSIIKAFKAVRPKNDLAEKVAALPYDVMNTAEAREMASGNPFSFLHVSRAEIDLPQEVDEHSQEVYNKAKQNFDKMQADGVLIQDKEPYLYIYAQKMDGRRQVGLVASSSIEDYFNDIIKKHELTRPEKEKDRIDHMQTIQAHVGPIFLTYPKNNSVDEIVNGIISQKPVYDFTANDGVQHTVWVVDNKQTVEQIISIFNKQIPYTYIADGHHRTASAAKVGLKMREKNPKHTGNEEYNFFLSVLFPDDQLAIMDYNRVVKDLNGLSATDFKKKVEEKFSISKGTMTKPAKLHEFLMYLEGEWLKLLPKTGTYNDNDPIGVLDITIMQDNLLAPLLGINDPRTDKRIDFIGGIRGLEELKRRVDNGEMKVAFALYPVSLKQLMDIANSGKIMPPKSTWFEPKLRDGLFSHLF